MSIQARLLPLLALLLPGCGDESPGGAAAAGAFHRLELSFEGEAPCGDLRAVDHLEPPAGIAPWRVEPAGDVRVGPIPTFEGQGEDVLIVMGGGDKRVSIPGVFDPAAFNQVQVTLLVRARSPLSLSLRKEGVELSRSEEVWLPGADKPHLARLSMPNNRLANGQADELVLMVGEEGGPLLLSSIDLLWMDYGALLPLAGGEPRQVRIADQGRQACGLSSRRPLRARIPEVPGGRLSFSMGVAHELALTSQRPVLELKLTDEGGREESFSYPFFTPKWTFVELSLDGWAGDLEARFSLAVSGAGEAVCALGEVAVHADAAQAPTVLLVTSDTHRADHLGAAQAGVEISTPALDALAKRGVMFEQGWSSSNVTIPSHVALLTGTHPRDTRIIDNRTSLASAAPTLAEAFRRRGYVTYAVVSTRHLSDSISGLGQGFDRMDAPSTIERPGSLSVDILDGWLQDARGRPLFVWLHLFDAHGPYQAPQEISAAYLSGVDATDDHAVQRASYRGEVSFVDAQLDRVLSRQRFSEGVVAVTADHGESLGAHEIYFAHLELYPDTVHVPLLLSWPDGPRGLRVRTRSRQIDLGRTLLDLAGLNDVEFPGRSLLEAVEDGAAMQRPVFALSANASSASVTDGPLHLILHLYEHHVGPGKQGRLYARHETELFNLSDDPSCERDLAAEGDPGVGRLRQLLANWLARATDPGWATQAGLDPEVLRDLEAIGYVVNERSDLGEGWIDPDCPCARCERWR